MWVGQYLICSSLSKPLPHLLLDPTYPPTLRCISANSNQPSFLTTSMVESSDEPSLLRRAYASCNPFGAGAGHQPVLPLTNDSAQRDPNTPVGSTVTPSNHAVDNHIHVESSTKNNVPEKPSSTSSPSASPPNETGSRETSTAIESDEKPNVTTRFYRTLKDILLSTSLNVLLIFVPIGIAVKVAGVNPTIVFAMNAIAIIPLAGLLSHATESVASELGDTIGALMNVTFGNAVELIIL